MRTKRERPHRHHRLVLLTFAVALIASALASCSGVAGTPTVDTTSAGPTTEQATGTTDTSEESSTLPTSTAERSTAQTTDTTEQSSTQPTSTAERSTAQTTVQPTGPTAQTTAGLTTTGNQVDYPLGLNLVWTGPVGLQVSPFDLESTVDCANGHTAIPSATSRITLKILAADCPTTTEPPINGRHGAYLTPPAFAQDITHPGTVNSGTLTVFTQIYTECTNSCTDYTDTVGLITLAGVPDYAVIMLVRTGPSGNADPAAIVAAACGIAKVGSRSKGAGTACPAG